MPFNRGRFPPASGASPLSQWCARHVPKPSSELRPKFKSSLFPACVKSHSKLKNAHRRVPRLWRGGTRSKATTSCHKPYQGDHDQQLSAALRAADLSWCTSSAAAGWGSGCRARRNPVQQLAGSQSVQLGEHGETGVLSVTSVYESGSPSQAPYRWGFL